MTTAISNEQLFVTTALTSWKQWHDRTGKTFDAISDDQMLTELFPGKNRLVYIFGHLIAVNDAIIPQLRLGEAAYPTYRSIFIENPDRAVAELPSVSELRQNWKDLDARLDGLFQALTPEQWLERHAMVSAEDFAKEPHRNRLALLQSRTAHVAYHLGQLKLLPK